MRATSKIIVLAKSIDGGTDTFVESLLKLTKRSRKTIRVYKKALF